MGCYGAGKYGPILIKFVTQTVKIMLSSNSAKEGLWPFSKMAAAAILKINELL
jgi:hypothetical protein